MKHSPIHTRPVKLLLCDTDIGVQERAAHILYDPSDEGKCGEYRLWPEVAAWCAQYVGGVELEHLPDNSAEITFRSQAARMLFIINYDLHFVLDYVGDHDG